MPSMLATAINRVSYGEAQMLVMVRSLTANTFSMLKVLACSTYKANVDAYTRQLLSTCKILREVIWHPEGRRVTWRVAPHAVEDIT